MENSELNTNVLLKKLAGTSGLQIINKMLVVGLTIALARLFTPDEFGRYSFLISVIMLASIPLVAGLPNLLMREISALRASEQWNILSSLLIWSNRLILVTSLAIAACLLVFFIFIHEGDSQISFLLALLFVPLRGYAFRYMGIMNGLSKPEWAQICQSTLVTATVCLLILIFSFFEKVTLNYVFSSYIVGGLTSLLVGWKLTTRFTIESKITKINNLDSKKWLTSLLPFSLLTVISVFNTELSSFTLGLTGAFEEVGYFKIAVQGMILISIVQQSMNMIIGPKITTLYAKSDLLSLQKVIGKSVIINGVYAMLTCFILFGFGKDLIELVFGAEYSSSINMLKILCIGQVINVITGPAGLLLNMSGNERLSLRVLSFSLCVNICLIIVLVPLYQGIGAAIATSFSLVLSSILLMISVQQKLGIRTWLRYQN